MDILIAIKEERWNIFDQLLNDNTSDLNIPDESGNTAAHLLVANNKPQELQRLLMTG